VREGSEHGVSLFNDIEAQEGTKSKRRPRPRHRHAAAAQEQDEDILADDYEAWLLASGIANPGGAEHLEWMRLHAYNRGGDF